MFSFGAAIKCVEATSTVTGLDTVSPCNGALISSVVRAVTLGGTGVGFVRCEAVGVTEQSLLVFFASEQEAPPQATPNISSAATTNRAAAFIAHFPSARSHSEGGSAEPPNCTNLARLTARF